MSRLTQQDEIFVPKYQKFQDILSAHERAHWIADEADMSQDVTQWKNGTISEKEKEYIKMILRLFTQADHNVAGGYVEKLLPVFKQADARMMLLSFANRETSSHVLGYKRLNDTLGYDDEAFMSEFLAFQEMKAKHLFMVEQSDMKSVKGVAEYLAKQLMVEGVNLFASFAMLLNFSREGKLPGMVSVNEWSIRDENLHCDGLSELFKAYLQEHPRIVDDEFKRGIYETIRKVVELEEKFIDLCYGLYSPASLPKEQLKDYIRYIADFRAEQIGLKRQFSVKDNPLEWIDGIMGGQLKNFFEVTVTDYSKHNLSGDWKY